MKMYKISITLPSVESSVFNVWLKDTIRPLFKVFHTTTALEHFYSDSGKLSVAPVTILHLAYRDGDMPDVQTIVESYNETFDRDWVAGIEVIRMG